VTKIFYRGSLGAILIFDVTNYESLNSIKNWKNSIDNNVEEFKIGTMILGLVY
jgi:GTPase SAR1 family protein